MVKPSVVVAVDDPSQLLAVLGTIAWECYFDEKVVDFETSRNPLEKS